MEKITKKLKLQAARIAKNAAYDGRVAIAKFPGGDPFIAEYIGEEFNPDAIEIYSLPTCSENPWKIKEYIEYMEDMKKRHKQNRKEKQK